MQLFFYLLAFTSGFSLIWNFFQRATPPPKLKTLKTNKLGYFQETENIYIGVSQTLLAITIIVVLLVPSYMI
jgi:hypothetical protein